jgi:hypothetical protein
MPEYAHFTSPEAAEEIKATQVLNSGQNSLWGFVVGHRHIPCDIPMDRLGENMVCVVFTTSVTPYQVDEHSAFWRWQDTEGELPVQVESILSAEEGFELLGMSCCDKHCRSRMI